ncbi:alpha/beta hydrolase [Gordonia sp. PKS22-38]|uniref:Alpha/beta hydrolase n=1 Tax=Gordonia prachuapensis TaxID=3115651 RepID=A0ABU7MXK7_9ACTN|nr:alpha/beta hydrolase [Gordonia sp. PKS22-38]
MVAITIPAQPGETTEVKGSPASAEAMAQRLTNAANTVEGQQDFAEGGAKKDVGVKGGVWSGGGASAYLGAIAPFASETSTAYTGLTRGARALTVYGDKLTDLKRVHDELTDRRADLVRSISNFETEVRSWEGKEIPAATLADLQARSSALTEQVNTYTTDNTTLKTDTEANERSLVSGLGAFGGVATSGRSLAAQGYDPAVAIRSALDKVGKGANPQDLGRMSAEERARWWAGLTPAERDAALQEFPEYLGKGGEGLPPSVRDIASRQNLDRDISQAQAVLAAPFRGSPSPAHPDPGSKARSDAEKTLEKALTVRGALEDASERARGAPVYLYDYDAQAFGGDGKAVVGIGNLDTARHVSWNVPGLTTDITKTPNNVDAAINLYNAAGGAEAGVASVAWIGYDAPSGADTGAVAFSGAAEDGGNRLASDIEGFVAARDQMGLGQGEGAADKLDVHLIGHSYGSVTTGWAADDGRLAGDVDTITLIGSPGAGGAATAEEFGIGEKNVYVGSASDDTVTFLGGTAGGYPGLGGLGTDPATTDFGAERFRAEGGDTTLGIGSHTSYYQRGSESLDNLAEIASGHGEDISHEDRRSNWDVYGIGGDPARSRDGEGE